MLNVSIIGATGYVGEELIGLLLNHQKVRIVSVSRRNDLPRKIQQIFPKFEGRLDLVCQEPRIEEICAVSDLVFLALPHMVSQKLVPDLLKAGKRVIDLSADYRLEEPKIYEEFYATKHVDPVNLKKAVYGLPELYRNKIKDARLVACPGCYPTAAILSLAPLVSLGVIDPDSIIIDAKSGVTGAGKKLAEGFLFSEVNEDFKAYKVNVHQHSPEINQLLSKLAGKKIKATFVPHLLSVSRGILETIYVNKTKNLKVKSKNLIELYKKFYKNEPFVRIREDGDFPRLKDVVRTNYCDISVKEFEDKIIIISAIDNLLKGASGQAVQNMNIMCKFPETTALL